MRYIKPLRELGRFDLFSAGGKAANLGALINDGFPVPGGFCILTEAYRSFSKKNRLDDKIPGIIKDAQPDDIGSLERASVKIRELFGKGVIPCEITEEIRLSYSELKSENQAQKFFVAVRSSATAEDLPGLSFAGQQDTYLNILGEDSLMRSVLNCWASLWNARAIGYRARNKINENSIALAVAVQAMVDSEVSGVMFTADPLTGCRTRMVIEAAFGLGEALVSGQVEPDNYAWDTIAGSISGKVLGRKNIRITGNESGGTIVSEDCENKTQALDDEKIHELARMGHKAALLFQAPQDIEWAVSRGVLYILQSRPITSLYPIPDGGCKDAGKLQCEAWLSFGVWQGMLDPYTPVGQYFFKGIAAGLGKKLGFASDFESQKAFINSGERLFLNITGLVRNKIGRKILPEIMAFLDPPSRDILFEIFKDQRFSLKKNSLKIKNMIKMAGFIALIAFNTFRILINPVKGRLNLENKMTEFLESFGKLVNSSSSIRGMVNIIEDIMIKTVPFLLPRIIPAVSSGQAASVNLQKLTVKLPGGPALFQDLQRGVPHNVTIEMDLALWESACRIKGDKKSEGYFNRNDPGKISKEYLEGRLPGAAQPALDGFMKKYGMRGIAEIDIGRPRWKEEPLYIIETLKRYMEIKNDDSTPASVFMKRVENAELAEEEIIREMKSAKQVKLKIIIVKWLIRRVRELAGLREMPKFFVIRIFDIFREGFLLTGEKLAGEGVLNRSDDIFYLKREELKVIEEDKNSDWKALVNKRREIYDHEKMRKRIPRVILNDGTCFYEGTGGAADGKTVIGNPVSAGTVEGTVRIVRDPGRAKLKQGEILVCPATDPAWTPLFLSAGGLIMETGGMMTHGSVVAREYGIPAVVGVNRATEILRDGQKVRVDGSSGKVFLLDE